jgi:TolB-like protein/Flp pilus assembly protein TadD
MRELIGRTIGHYRIVEKIGEGGMGEVYRAHDERLDRDVAIKVLPSSVAQDPERIARFEREAKAVAKLEHPNILAIYDFGTDEDITYSVTELLEGETLRERLEGGALGWRKGAEIGAAIADGLAAAHGAGIIHRDLKPDNVFLTADGRVKILDFGLARDVTAAAPDETHSPTVSRYTDPGAVMGTAGYMSPEQVRGEPADAQSDIFSLGSVLYEMATGRRAFARDTAAETMTAILREEPGDYDIADNDVPLELRRIVVRCLEKNPEERFQSARDLAFDLRSIATQERGVGTGRQPATGRTPWRWLAAGGLIVVIAAVAIWRLAPSASAPATPEAIPRIVVLPFENLGSPDDEYFADGITEQLISRLAAVSGLQVISRTSAMYYEGKNVPLKQIGEELDVGYVLEGTIRWDRGEGDHGRVRITPQLIHVEDDAHLWAERYDRVLEDIFSVQSEIADAVVGELQMTLIEKEKDVSVVRPTESIEAYQAFLRGRHLDNQPTWSQEWMAGVVQSFQRATELDPDFALAYAELASSHCGYYLLGHDRSAHREQLAWEALGTALTLAPDDPKVHLAIGRCEYAVHKDYPAALKELELAAAGLPNDVDVLCSIAAVNRRWGRYDNALEEFKRAFELDPRSAVIAAELAFTSTMMRRHADAMRYCDRSIALSPDQVIAFSYKARNVLMSRGDLLEAKKILEAMPFTSSQAHRAYRAWFDLHLCERNWPEALRVLDEAGLDWWEFPGSAIPGSLLKAQVLTRIGDHAEALRAFDVAVVELESRIANEPDDHRLHAALGLAYAGLGRKEQAVREGHRAVELLPIVKDAYTGTTILKASAQIHAEVGEHEKALDQLETLLSVPSLTSVPLLRLEPSWDPLRDDPRFQALLEKYDTN